MRYCGREFTEEELAWIRQLMANRPELNRKDLSVLFCQEANWLKPDGGVKDMSCRVAMLRMERDGHLVLPPPRAKHTKRWNKGRSREMQVTLTWFLRWSPAGPVLCGTSSSIATIIWASKPYPEPSCGILSKRKGRFSHFWVLEQRPGRRPHATTISAGTKPPGERTCIWWSTTPDS